MLKWSERARARVRLKELHLLAEIKHDVDLHEGVHDEGEMTFCPGCEAHTKLYQVERELDDPTFTTPGGFVSHARIAPKLARINALVGQTLTAGDMSAPPPPPPPSPPIPPAPGGPP